MIITIVVESKIIFLGVRGELQYVFLEFVGCLVLLLSFKCVIMCFIDLRRVVVMSV